MYMEDKLVADTEDKKNELEAHIYELRGKIDEQYAEFASEEEKTALRAKLEDVEVSLLQSRTRRGSIICSRFGAG